MFTFVVSRDTSPVAARVQAAVWRRMTPGQKIRLAIGSSEEARAITSAGIKARHPDYTDAEIRDALFRVIYGDELFRRVWPGRRLLPA